MKIHDDHTHLRPHVEPPPKHALAPLLARADEMNVVPGIREHIPLPEKFRLGPNEDFGYAMRTDEVFDFITQFQEAGIRSDSRWTTSSESRRSWPR